LFQTYGLILPLTKLLMADTYAEIMEGGPLISHLGRGRLHDFEVEHVAIHGGHTDIQLWIESGENPIIRKIATRNRRVATHPRYVATFTRFEVVERLGDEIFEPTLTTSMKETEFTRSR
jgi:hypothetical protein